jgi:ArsR family transcriptional regulator
MHLGSFMSFILYPHDVVIFFSAENVLDGGGETSVASVPISQASDSPIAGVDTLEGNELLESLRALGDPNRMRILDLLGSGELYANEIVGRLGIAQSAVSRHLSQLERSGLVVVHPRGGMKYYGINCQRLAAVGETLRSRALASSLAGGTAIATD